MPDALVGDQVRLRQVLLNLLNNAAKFTDAGSIDVKVWLDGASGKTAHMHFDVRDTGVGIPPDKLELIFEAVCQVDGSNTRRYGGTGLGLTISSRLVALMNGWLWVESTLGKGSEFHFTADFQLGADSAVQPQKRGAETPDALRGRSEALRILLAEDNLVNQKITSKLLETKGHSVTSVLNGREVLAALECAEFDLGLMDIQMRLWMALSVRPRSVAGKRRAALISPSSRSQPTPPTATGVSGAASTSTLPNL